MKHVATKDQIIQFLEQKLEPNRFDHVISVRDTAVALAEKYGLEQQKVELSALLHDCAKWMKNDQLIKICQRNQIEVDFIEKVYDNVKNPLGYICNKINYYTSNTEYNLEKSINACIVAQKRTSETFDLEKTKKYCEEEVTKQKEAY